MDEFTARMSKQLQIEEGVSTPRAKHTDNQEVEVLPLNENAKPTLQPHASPPQSHEHKLSDVLEDGK